MKKKVMGRKEERNNFNKQPPSWALARKCTHTERGMKEAVTVSGCAHCPSTLHWSSHQSP